MSETLQFLRERNDFFVVGLTAVTKSGLWAVHWFTKVTEAKEVIKAWRREFNE